VGGKVSEEEKEKKEKEVKNMARKKTTAEEVTRDAVAAFAGMAVMGESSKLVPAQGSRAVSTAYGAMGLASTGMTLKAAKGVMSDLDKLGSSVRWRGKK